MTADHSLGLLWEIDRLMISNALLPVRKPLRASLGAQFSIDPTLTAS